MSRATFSRPRIHKIYTFKMFEPVIHSIPKVWQFFLSDQEEYFIQTRKHVRSVPGRPRFSWSKRNWTIPAPSRSVCFLEYIHLCLCVCIIGYIQWEVNQMKTSGTPLFIFFAGIYILAIIPPNWKTGKNFEEDLMKKGREKGGKEEKNNKTQVKIPLWSLNDRKKSTKTGEEFKKGEIFWLARKSK